jgi:hypothetical protein
MTKMEMRTVTHSEWVKHVSISRSLGNSGEMGVEGRELEKEASF